MKITNKTLPDVDIIFQRINEDADSLRKNIHVWVEGRKSLKGGDRAELENYERKMFTFLWYCRPLLTTVVIARMVGLSRQGLYYKWAKFGFDTSDDIK